MECGIKANSYVVSDALDFIRQLAIQRIPIGAMVTSPPYNLGLHRRSSLSRSNWRTSKLFHDGYGAHDDALPRDEYVTWQRSILTAALDVVGPAGVVCYQHKPVIRDGLCNMQTDILDGFPLRQLIIWDRGSTNNHERSFCPPTYEFIAVLAGRRWRLPDDGYRESRKWGSVWTLYYDRRNTHEAPFPVELARRMCLFSHGAVMDPFAGSGTTGIGAVQAGRDYYLADNNPNCQQQFIARNKPLL